MKVKKRSMSTGKIFYFLSYPAAERKGFPSTWQRFLKICRVMRCNLREQGLCGGEALQNAAAAASQPRGHRLRGRLTVLA